MKPSARAAAAVSATARTKKRRVAFTLAYLGDRFHGSQHQGPDLRTCEQRLERAIYRAGMLVPSNYGDPLKNGFNRASRTDKGVHALSAVVSLKIEVADDGAFHPCTGHLDSSIVDRIRTHLPGDMAVLSCTQVGKKFNARDAANFRSYRYYLPKHIFLNSAVDSSSAQNMEEVRASLKHNLSAFCGTHFFHNFTRGARRKHGAHALPENMASPESTLPDSLMSTGRRSGNSSLRRTILHCGIESEDDRYFHVRIAGQSFIYNQIRAMIGTATAVTAGLVPKHQPFLALSERAPLYATPAPLAPAAPLVQTDCSFTPQSRVLMRASDAREIFGDNSTPRKTDPNRPLRVLMDADAEARAAQFIEDVVCEPMWDNCQMAKTVEEFLGLDAAQGAGLARLRDSEWSQMEHREEGASATTFVKRRFLSNDVRLPNGLSTAASVRFGLRPGCLIKDAIGSLKEELGRQCETGGEPHPDMETCVKLLEPLLQDEYQDGKDLVHRVFYDDYIRCVKAGASYKDLQAHPYITIPLSCTLSDEALELRHGRRYDTVEEDYEMALSAGWPLEDLLKHPFYSTVLRKKYETRRSMYSVFRDHYLVRAKGGANSKDLVTHPYIAMTLSDTDTKLLRFFNRKEDYERCLASGWPLEDLIKHPFVTITLSGRYNNTGRHLFHVYNDHYLRCVDAGACSKDLLKHPYITVALSDKSGKFPALIREEDYKRCLASGWPLEDLVKHPFATITLPGRYRDTGRHLFRVYYDHYLRCVDAGASSKDLLKHPYLTIKLTSTRGRNDNQAYGSRLEDYKRALAADWPLEDLVKHPYVTVTLLNKRRSRQGGEWRHMALVFRDHYLRCANAGASSKDLLKHPYITTTLSDKDQHLMSSREEDYKRCLASGWPLEDLIKHPFATVTLAGLHRGSDRQLNRVYYDDYLRCANAGASSKDLLKHPFLTVALVSKEKNLPSYINREDDYKRCLASGWPLQDLLKHPFAKVTPARDSQLKRDRIYQVHHDHFLQCVYEGAAPEDLLKHPWNIMAPSRGSKSQR